LKDNDECHAALRGTNLQLLLKALLKFVNFFYLAAKISQLKVFNPDLMSIKNQCHLPSWSTEFILKDIDECQYKLTAAFIGTAEICQLFYLATKILQ
jgi:hypothetical protein